MDVSSQIATQFNVDFDFIQKRVHHIEHHRAHLASSYYVSGFQKAALLSVDGLGDFSSVMMGIGVGSEISIIKNVQYPHSLGLFYTAMTQYLGYSYYGEEYKVMGLASYGTPKYIEEMRKIVLLKSDGTFELNLKYFQHHSKGMSMSYAGGSPDIGQIYSSEWEKLLGSVRGKGDKVLQRHMDIASSAQRMYEEALFHILNKLATESGLDHLCLAGGCGYNSVANGKISTHTPFKSVYIQSACGDSGGAIGAAYYVFHSMTRTNPFYKMTHAYWGPMFSEEQIKDCLEMNIKEIKKAKCNVNFILDEDDLCQKTAQFISEGKVIGWFQGASEWGPRALGNRSIVVDPRRGDMKALLNAKIKKRESYRPFAPSIKRESVKDYFEIDADVPFMLMVFQIKKNMQDKIPAVTHVDGSGRLQTVDKSTNLRYWKLIDEFEKITGVPVVLNTSFNENEPVVNTPQEALSCFLRTQMDVLVLGQTIIKR